MKTPSTASPFGLYFAYVAWRSVASARQSGHQLAPKVSHVGWPLSAAMETIEPSSAVAWKSGGTLPARGGEPAAAPPGRWVTPSSDGLSTTQATTPTRIAATARTRRVRSRPAARPAADPPRPGRGGDPGRGGGLGCRQAVRRRGDPPAGRSGGGLAPARGQRAARLPGDGARRLDRLHRGAQGPTHVAHLRGQLVPGLPGRGDRSPGHVREVQAEGAGGARGLHPGGQGRRPGL